MPVAGLTLEIVGIGPVTTTVAWPVLVPVLAVIVAGPMPAPVTSPDAFTVAIKLSELEPGHGEVGQGIAGRILDRRRELD